MKNYLAISIVSVVFCSCAMFGTKETSNSYYANGLQKFNSETIIIGKKKDEFGTFKKTINRTWKYYESGELELIQKTTEKPASGKRNETTGEPINKIPKKVRRYKRYDHAGKLTEKGWEKTRKSKNVLYDSGIYKKVITKKNQEWRFPKVKYLEKEKPTKNLKIQYVSPEDK